jgi:hypothetical protein
MVLPLAAGGVVRRLGGMRVTVLLVGDDWAGDHHDIELMDQAGRTLARARPAAAPGAASPS